MMPAIESRRLSIQRLTGFAQAIFKERSDVTVVEGAGGWRVPFNLSEYLLIASVNHWL